MYKTALDVVWVTIFPLPPRGEKREEIIVLIQIRPEGVKSRLLPLVPRAHMLYQRLPREDGMKGESEKTRG